MDIDKCTNRTIIKVLTYKTTFFISEMEVRGMASELAIKAAIDAKVRAYFVWTIGVTDEPNRRRREHDNPRVWYHWDADSEQVARDVEAFFLGKGMKGGTGGGGWADYVYIFL